MDDIDTRLRTELLLQNGTKFPLHRSKLTIIERKVQHLLILQPKEESIRMCFLDRKLPEHKHSTSTNKTMPSKRSEEKKVPEKKVYQVSNFKDISFDDLSELFHLPISVAALTLQVSESYLKRLCRTFNVHRWPYRRLEALRVQIISLEHTFSVENDEDNRHVLRQRINAFKEEMKYIKETGIDNSVKRKRSPTLVTAQTTRHDEWTIELLSEEQDTRQPLPLSLKLDIENLYYCLNT